MYLEDNEDLMEDAAKEYLQDNQEEVRGAAVDKYIENNEEEVSGAAVDKYLEDNEDEVHDSAVKKYIADLDQNPKSQVKWLALHAPDIVKRAYSKVMKSEQQNAEAESSKRRRS